MTNVLIAIDGSELDRSVLAAAHELFGDAAHYLIVNVHNEPLVYSSIALAHGMASAMSAPELLRFVEDDASDDDDLVAAAQQLAAEAGLTDVEFDVEAGDPATAILAVAEDHQVDVIAVGSHGRSRFERLMAPSVSKQLVDRARRPVLVVPTDDPTPG